MMTSPEHHPDCLGFIDLKYGDDCEDCEYTVMCVHIVLTEKWDYDQESKAEDTKKT